MKRAQRFFEIAAGLVIIGALALGAVVAFRALSGGGAAGAQAGTPQGYPPPQETGQFQATPTPLQEGYPPPPVEVQPVTEAPELLPTSTPVVSAPFPETPPLPAGKAATLHNGNIWLVEPGREPEALTDFGDMAVIFGWNRDGTLLLFGRGRVEQTEFVGDTTELWVFDVNARQARQLTTGSLVKSAAWSPVDDQIAYCELGDVLTVVTVDGEKLHQLEQAICTFTWSPDGLAISLPTYTPDMIDSDGLKYTVLAAWWLSNDTLQVFSDSKDEGQGWPVWSIDSKRILFVRDYYESSKQELSGLHVVDVAGGQIQRLEGKTVSAEELTRSPRSDLVAYRIGPDIFVTDFEGRAKIVGQGRSLLWLSDGKTLLYRALDGKFQVATFDTQVLESAVGGQRPVTGLYIQPEYFFAPGG